MLFLRSRRSLGGGDDGVVIPVILGGDGSPEAGVELAEGELKRRQGVAGRSSGLVAWVLGVGGALSLSASRSSGAGGILSSKLSGNESSSSSSSSGAKSGSVESSSGRLSGWTSSMV